MKFYWLFVFRVKAASIYLNTCTIFFKFNFSKSETIFLASGKNLNIKRQMSSQPLSKSYKYNSLHWYNWGLYINKSTSFPYNDIYWIYWSDLLSVTCKIYWMLLVLLLMMMTVMNKWCISPKIIFLWPFCQTTYFFLFFINWALKWYWKWYSKRKR